MQHDYKLRRRINVVNDNPLHIFCFASTMNWKDRKDLERRSKAELIEMLLDKDKKRDEREQKGTLDWSKYAQHHIAFKVCSVFVFFLVIDMLWSFSIWDGICMG